MSPAAVEPTAVDPAAVDPDRRAPGGEETGPLGADSLVWRLGFARASLLLAGRALLLQVAHPTVGAGVRDFSAFRTDPWGRLDRTVTSLLAQLFGGEGASVEARRLQAMHRGIRGTGFDGRAYRALEPAAWAWVHIANADTTLRWHALAGSLASGLEEPYWAEWRRVGRLLGIADRHLPPDVAGMRAHVDGMAATVLGDNETVRALLDTLTLDDVPPPAPSFPGPVWSVLRPLGRRVLLDATVGTAPPALRERLGLAWSDADRRRLDRTLALVRRASLLLPDRVGHYGVAYRAMVAARSAGDGHARLGS